MRVWARVSSAISKYRRGRERWTHGRRTGLQEEVGLVKPLLCGFEVGHGCDDVFYSM